MVPVGKLSELRLPSSAEILTSSMDFVSFSFWGGVFAPLARDYSVASLLAGLEASVASQLSRSLDQSSNPIQSNPQPKLFTAM